MSQDTMDAERDGRREERRRIVRYIRREAQRLHRTGKADPQSGKIAECFFLLAQRVDKLVARS